MRTLVYVIRPLRLDRRISTKRIQERSACSILFSERKYNLDTFPLVATHINAYHICLKSQDWTEINVGRNGSLARI